MSPFSLNRSFSRAFSSFGGLDGPVELHTTPSSSPHPEALATPLLSFPSVSYLDEIIQREPKEESQDGCLSLSEEQRASRRRFPPEHKSDDIQPLLPLSHPNQPPFFCRTHSFPTSLEMFEASLFEVIDGDNKKWSFGDLIKGQKTIVVFIRHWYCPLCSGAFFLFPLARSWWIVAGLTLLHLGLRWGGNRLRAFNCRAGSPGRTRTSGCQTSVPSSSSLFISFLTISKLTFQQELVWWCSDHHRQRRSGGDPFVPGEGVPVSVSDLYRSYVGVRPLFLSLSILSGRID